MSLRLLVRHGYAVEQVHEDVFEHVVPADHHGLLRKVKLELDVFPLGPVPYLLDRGLEGLLDVHGPKVPGGLLPQLRHRADHLDQPHHALDLARRAVHHLRDLRIQVLSRPKRLEVCHDGGGVVRYVVRQKIHVDLDLIPRAPQLVQELRVLERDGCMVREHDGGLEVVLVEGLGRVLLQLQHPYDLLLADDRNDQHRRAHFWRPRYVRAPRVGRRIIYDFGLLRARDITCESDIRRELPVGHDLGDVRAGGKDRVSDPSLPVVYVECQLVARDDLGKLGPDDPEYLLGADLLLKRRSGVDQRFLGLRLDCHLVEHLDAAHDPNHLEGEVLHEADLLGREHRDLGAVAQEHQPYDLLAADEGNRHRVVEEQSAEDLLFLGRLLVSVPCHLRLLVSDGLCPHGEGGQEYRCALCERDSFRGARLAYELVRPTLICEKGDEIDLEVIHDVAAEPCEPLIRREPRVGGTGHALGERPTHLAELLEHHHRALDALVDHRVHRELCGRARDVGKVVLDNIEHDVSEKVLLLHHRREAIDLRSIRPYCALEDLVSLLRVGVLTPLDDGLNERLHPVQPRVIGLTELPALEVGRP